MFVAEVEREVAEGRADLAVHSAKDLTSELAPGCEIACIPSRASVEDAVVGGEGRNGEERLASLAPDARLGTSSMRRRALVTESRPDLEVVELRGNLDTRLAKVAQGEVTAAIVAAAGLERLGHGDIAAAGRLDPERWVPAPAQGALAIEARAERHDLVALLSPLRDERATAEVLCERAFSEHLEGGCSVPLGCRARSEEARLVVTGFLGEPEGGNSLRDRISGPADQAVALGRELAAALLSSGGDALLEEARATAAPIPSPP